MHFFLEKDVVILTFKLFFQDNVVDGINLVKVILDSFDSFLNMFLPLENVAKDLLIEIDWVLFDIVERNDGIMVWGVPGCSTKGGVVFMINPGSFKPERSWPSGLRETTKAVENRIMIIV